MTAAGPARNVNAHLVHAAVMGAVALDCLGVGLVMPILPRLLHSKTVGATLYGAVQSVAYAATLLCSSCVGRLSDQRGRKAALVVAVGLGCAGYLALLASAHAAYGSEVQAGPEGGVDSMWLGFALAALGRITCSCGHASIQGPANAAMLDCQDAMRMPGDGAVRGGGSSDAAGRTLGALGLGFAVGSALGGRISKFGAVAPVALAGAGSLLALVGVAWVVPDTASAQAAPEGGTATARAPVRRLLQEALSQPRTRLLLLMQVLSTFSFRLFTSTAALYMTDFLGFSAEELGYILSFAGWAFALTALLVVPVVTKAGIRPEVLLRLAFFSTMLGRFGLAAASVLPPAATIIASYCFISLGQSTTMTLISALMADTAQPQHLGFMLGLLTSCGTAASVVAPVLAGACYEHVDPVAPAVCAGLVSLCGCGVAFCYTPPAPTPAARSKGD